MAETVKRRYSRLVAELAAQPMPANAPGERLATLEVNLPDLILIDGGKGQLSAACEELAKLGLSHIPVIGLAKEFEEIHRPSLKEPLRLSHESGALKLLQRVRDESHRLANTYNAQLRLKRISESLLDEFPGIGSQRKAALLKRFGSVRRLQRASLEEISSVPGFGGKAAAELVEFLKARQEPSSLRTQPDSPKRPNENPGQSM
jgi:excinuclease ABC subunit C